MNEIVERDVINIETMIYEIDGKEVMLDTDLAKLYNVETKRINEAVKNNPEKFPDRYLFRITDKEYNSLKSKISTSKGGSRKGHTAFVEQGVYMLATILKSNVATEVSIRIMDTFVKMRHYINYNNQILPHKYLLLEEKVDNNTKRIDELFNKFNPKVITNNSIFFQNDIYDAYSILLEIFNSSKDEIIIIDNYIGGIMDSINELIEFIKIDKDARNNHGYLMCLNDENITLSEVFYRSNILAETDIDSDMSMVDIISEVCRGLKKALNTQDIFVAIELHSFAGYDASVNDGPIKLIFMGEDGKHVGLRFTTNSIKNSNWLIGFMRYTEGMSDLFGQEKNIDEYNKLSDFLYKLEFGNDEIDMCQEDNSPQK